MNRTHEKPPFELRGGHVLWSIILFFGAIIAINILFAMQAVSTFPGEDAPRAYVQGVKYNQVIADRRTQAAWGWRASATLAPDPAGAALIVRLQNAHGAPITDAVLTGALRRPTDARLDRALAFTTLGGGEYRAILPDLEPGQWRLRAAARRGDRRFDIGAWLTWPSST